MLQISRTGAPIRQRDQDPRQRQQLADLNADIEADDVFDQTVGRQVELLQFRCESEAVKQTKDQDRRSRVRLKSKHALKATEIFEPLVDNRESDDRVDQKWIDAN